MEWFRVGLSGWDCYRRKWRNKCVTAKGGMKQSRPFSGISCWPLWKACSQRKWRGRGIRTLNGIFDTFTAIFSFPYKSYNRYSSFNYVICCRAVHLISNAIPDVDKHQFLGDVRGVFAKEQMPHSLIKIHITPIYALGFPLQKYGRRYSHDFCVGSPLGSDFHSWSSHTRIVPKFSIVSSTLAVWNFRYPFDFNSNWQLNWDNNLMWEMVQSGWTHRVMKKLAWRTVIWLLDG